MGQWFAGRPQMIAGKNCNILQRFSAQIKTSMMFSREAVLEGDALPFRCP
jgi:hypothetical protein